MHRAAHILIVCVCLLVSLPGCFVLQVGVTNPAPNLPRIAVAPFVNLSPERSVDGRRFAEAYYTELQKVPGFQVIPVGVVESAMHDYGLNLDTPRDMQKLLEILDADGLCFGAVTEYNPYYPPRLGLQISWYTSRTPDFQPGIPIDPAARSNLRKAGKNANGSGSWSQKIRCAIPGFPCSEPAHLQSGMSGTTATVTRAQNELIADEPLPGLIEPVRELTSEEQQAWEAELERILGVGPAASPASATGTTRPDSPEISPRDLARRDNIPAIQPVQREYFAPPPSFPAQQFPPADLANPEYDRPDRLAPESLPLPRLPQPQPLPEQSLAAPDFSVRPALPGENQTPEIPFPQPYMSYTRVFDGADADFTASLKNFLELSGDQRSGGWTGYMHRSEDFIRFCMHRMIVEMLQLHGGEAQRRFVMTSRKYQ